MEIGGVFVWFWMNLNLSRWVSSATIYFIVIGCCFQLRMKPKTIKMQIFCDASRESNSSHRWVGLKRSRAVADTIKFIFVASLNPNFIAILIFFFLNFREIFESTHWIDCFIAILGGILEAVTAVQMPVYSANNSVMIWFVCFDSY